ncbi:fluoride efflux transporter FluC [Cytobacillus kochii]
MSEILYVMIGGFFGAIARFSLSTLINSKTNSLFPYGTVIVNLLGCFLMGVVVHFLHWENVSALLVVGFFGGIYNFFICSVGDGGINCEETKDGIYIFFCYLYRRYSPFHVRLNNVAINRLFIYGQVLNTYLIGSKQKGNENGCKSSE